MTTKRGIGERSVQWLQVTAGQGPKECGWIVTQLYKRVLKAALKDSISAQVVEALAFDKALRKQNLVEPDAFLSVLIRLEGSAVKRFANSWTGSIKWEGESPYRPKHKRCNWFVGVELVSMLSQREIKLAELAKGVEFESMRSSGPGGQHVNKTNSAVRLKHKPTGINIRVDTDRSQHRNRRLAMERLQLMLGANSRESERAHDRKRWLNHYQVKRGSPTRIFHGRDFIEKS